MWALDGRFVLEKCFLRGGLLQRSRMGTVRRQEAKVTLHNLQVVQDKGRQLLLPERMLKNHVPRS